MRVLYVAAAAAALGLVVGLSLGLGIAAPSANQTVTTTTVLQSSLVVSDPTPYFPPSYLSRSVNMSGISNGDVVDVGLVEFHLLIPPNVETRTTQYGGTSTTITVTADYQCGSSLGQRIFFDARLPNAVTVRLDYCLVLNNAVLGMQRSGDFSTTWSLWQITLGTYPTVALHMSGTGEHVDSVELWSGA